MAMKQLQKPVSKPESLASRLLKVKLPRTAYWLCNDKILLLTNLRMAESPGDRCECQNRVVGEMEVLDGSEKYVNQYEVGINSLYESLPDAIAAMRRNDKIRERCRFINRHRHDHQGSKIRFLQSDQLAEYRPLMVEFYNSELNVADSPINELKAMHYRELVTRSFQEVKQLIAVHLFPDLTEDDVVEDDD